MYHVAAGFFSTASLLLFPPLPPVEVPHVMWVASNEKKKVAWSLKCPSKMFCGGLSLITPNALEVDNKRGMTESKQAICISKAISARLSSTSLYLSVCPPIWDPPLSLGVGANEGAGVKTKGRAEQKNWLRAGLWEQMKEMRQKKRNGVAWTQLIWGWLFFILVCLSLLKT